MTKNNIYTDIVYKAWDRGGYWVVGTRRGGVSILQGGEPVRFTREGAEEMVNFLNAAAERDCKLTN